MILCLQTLFGTGNILLWKDTENLLDVFSWKTKEIHPNLIAEISALLKRNSLHPGQIKELFVTAGPGPFTAVRTVSVLANTWKAAKPSVKIFSVLSGIFLEEKFPDAEHYFLSAGKTAFFAFDRMDMGKFQKLPMKELREFSGSFGGVFDPSTVLPDSLKKAFERPDEEAFRAIFEKKEKFKADELLPLYGAEANITPQKDAF